jgi:peptide/nickel transport system substrate-binding protein
MRAYWAIGVSALTLLGVCMGDFHSQALAQSAATTLVVAGPRTPESVDQEYPPTEAGHEARRNVYERLLRYAPKIDENGVKLEDFSKIEGALAESWEVSPDRKTISFKLRPSAKSYEGNELSADDVMWTFERGWNLKATFYWYMTQVLKITSFDAFKRVDDRTVSVTLPSSSPLIERLWVNNDLGIIDSKAVKSHLTSEDPWGSRWLSTHSASFAPYHITKYTPGQEVVYEANDGYWAGPPKLKRVIFREMPTSANRLAALQAGSIDVAEWLLPRELASLERVPSVKVWKVFGNYIHRVEMNNDLPPFDNPKVRQAMNYLVPREAIGKSVYFGTARPTESPISEIYPGFTDAYFTFTEDAAKAKMLLQEAGFGDGIKTQLGYRTGDQIEEEIAVILKTAFARAGVDVELLKLPSASLVERYTKGTMPMYFFRDMAIVPDAAYVANLWLNSASIVNYSHFKSEEVDKRINDGLVSTDEPERLKSMARVQEIVMDAAPWVFLFNPGYQLATRSNVKGYSWYTPNGNAWYDFYKE